MNARESNSSEATRTMRGHRVVKDALEMSRSFGAMQMLRDQDVARLCIIVEELFVNLYEHGGLNSEHLVTLTLRREPRGIRVVVTDPAPPFDPRSAADDSPRPERGGGAGIAIVRAWTEFIDYRATDEGNRLELLLAIHDQA